jgi:hypothetical protein
MEEVVNEVFIIVAVALKETIKDSRSVFIAAVFHENRDWGPERK